MVVRDQFEKAGLTPTSVMLGEVELENTPGPGQITDLKNSLHTLGFEVLDDQHQQQIDKVKKLLIQQVQTGSIEEHFMLSDFISRHFNKDYSQISRLFSSVEGITIEQYFILQKIEKVKEWLAYDELTLSEIAWKLGYSSVAHLSAQFKKVTGMTPSAYKTLGVSHRNSLEEVGRKKDANT
jgi:AraC-like DNA-binding protein